MTTEELKNLLAHLDDDIEVPDEVSKAWKETIKKNIDLPHE